MSNQTPTEAWVRPAVPQDAISMAPRLRAADRAELLAAGADSPQAALLSGIEAGHAEVAEDHFGPFMIFGVAPSALPWVGSPWMSATPRLLSYRNRFIRESREKVEELQRTYQVLTNYVDERNTLHHRWLQWCGFKFIRRVTLGPFDLPFIQFVRTRSDV